MKQTVLHEKHLEAKARLTEFQGWQVPAQFSDVAEECHAVRAAAGLFDLSYLGRIEVSGPGAVSLLQKVLTRSVSKMAEGSAHFSLLCNEAGFILADVLLFVLPDNKSGKRYFLTMSPVNSAKVLAWLKQHADADVEILDRTGGGAQIAVQGPRSALIIERLAGPHFKKLKPRAVRELTIADAVVLVSRTGYTGEHGYELMVPAGQAATLWQAVLDAGKDAGLLACGLAAREILRMEMGYLQYGNDLDEARTPVEAGLMSFVDLKKDFIGKAALAKLKTDGPKERFAGFVLMDKGVPKVGGSIFSENHEIGAVTSGVHSPLVRNGIGLGYVTGRYAQAGLEIEVETKDREVPAKIVELPFYRKKSS